MKSITGSAPRSEYYQSMVERFEKNSEPLDRLGETKSLKDFLNFANKHLKKNPTDATKIAHYLMGKVDDLPTNLKHPTPGLTKEQKAILYDVLRTNRYGLLGIAEANEKTIGKLAKLHELLPASDTGSQSSTTTHRHLVNFPNKPTPTARNSDTVALSKTPADAAQTQPAPAPQMLVNNAPPTTTSEVQPQTVKASPIKNPTQLQLLQTRKDKVNEILSKAPVELTSHPGWKTVQENMMGYLEQMHYSQGKDFDKLLEHSKDNLFELLASVKMLSKLEENKAFEMATTRDLFNLAMEDCPIGEHNQSAIGCKTSLARSQDNDVITPGNQLSLCTTTPIACSDGVIREVNILSCVAPALDTRDQPEFYEFVTTDELGNLKLNTVAYQKSLDTIREHIIATAKDKNSPRVVLSAIGSKAFLATLEKYPTEHEHARGMIAQMLADTAKELQNDGKEVIFTGTKEDTDFLAKINEYTQGDPEIAMAGSIPGKWIKENDLILNAWDSHSLTGNKLADDNSLDGFIGRSTLIHLMHALMCSMANAGVINKDGPTNKAHNPVVGLVNPDSLA